MIITFHQNSTKPLQVINQCSVVSVKNGSPIPVNEVIVNSSSKNSTKKAFSNNLVENGAVNKFIHGSQYTDAQVRWTPSTVSNSNAYQSYAFSTTLDKGPYTSDYSTATEKVPYGQYVLDYVLVNDARYPIPLPPKFGVCSLVEDPSMGEWPSPILLRTGNGTTIKFYNSTNFSNSNLLYSQACGSNGLTFVYNLIPNVTYYYQVYNSNNALVQNIYQSNSNYGTITTEGLTRFIKFSHIRNARDIGGYTTTDGSYRFKYGIIYRGSQLDSLNGVYNVTIPANSSSADKSEFSKLGITLELDLRDNISGQPTNGVSTMGSNIGYFKVSGSIVAYSDMGRSGGTYSKNGFNQFIAYLNKILTNTTGATYIHCQQGRDRTGTFIAVLQAICGIKSDYVAKDYELTSLWGNPTTRYHFQMNKVNNVYYATWQSLLQNNSGTTIQEMARNWFKYYYTDELDSLAVSAGVTLSNDTGTKKNQIIQYICDTLLEPTSSDPHVTPTPDEPTESQFVNKLFRVNSGGDTLVYGSTEDRWKYAEVQVSAGDQVTLSADSVTGGRFIKTTNGLFNSLNGTTDISLSGAEVTTISDYPDPNSTWVSGQAGSITYTAQSNGYLLIALYCTSANLSVVNPSYVVTSGSTPEPEEEIETKVRLTQWQPSDVNNGVSGYYYNSDTNFQNWSHYEIPVNQGDTVTVKLNSPSRPACCYVESNSGMISLMNTRTSNITFGSTVNVNTHIYFYTNGDKTYDGTAYGTVATTESSGRYLATHTINIRNTGKFTISVKRLLTGDDTLYSINGSESNCIQMGIYINGTLVYGRNLNF